MQNRIGSCKRKTKETDIELTINLDGQGKNQIDTGIPFFDHMLDGFARHGLFDLNVKVRGDLEVDSHHTSKIQESYWDRQSHRHLEIRPELSDTDILYCQWMRFLLLEQLTFPADRI